MLIHSIKRHVARAALLAMGAAIGCLPIGALPAQSLSVGAVVATILDERGIPMSEVTVTLERSGTGLRTITTDPSGVAAFAVIAPGRYAVLAEEFGYQPVRMPGVIVIGGSTSRVTLRLAHRPPPITGVEEQPANVTFVGTQSGHAAIGDELTMFARRHDISGVPDMFSEANAPRDGREGFVASANGLRPAFSSLIVDGVREALLRHPGLPDEPASAPLFARDGVDQVSYIGNGSSTEWPGTLGAILDAQSRRGSERLTIQPWIAFSGAKLGGRTVDNPGDSSAMSVQGGIAMGGPIKHDTASWFIRAEYQQLRQPAANPFEPGLATADTLADLAGAVRTAAQSLGHEDVSAWLAPAVRTWQGGSGAGRLDWRFGPKTLFAVRAGGAAWSEDNPQAGSEPVNGAGSHLKAQDITAAATLTTGSDTWTSDTRLGVHVSKRDWTGATLPFTELTGDAVAIGGAATLPGSFRETAVDVSETFAFRLGAHDVEGRRRTLPPSGQVRLAARQRRPLPVRRPADVHCRNRRVLSDRAHHAGARHRHQRSQRADRRQLAGDAGAAAVRRRASRSRIPAGRCDCVQQRMGSRFGFAQRSSSRHHQERWLRSQGRVLLGSERERHDHVARRLRPGAGTIRSRGLRRGGAVRRWR